MTDEEMLMEIISNSPDPISDDLRAKLLGPKPMNQGPVTMAQGGRTGFFKAGIVKQGPNTGKWSVADFDADSRRTVFFESEELANKAIADRKIKTSRYEKSRNILNDPKLKKQFIKYGNSKNVTGKMIREKFKISKEEFTQGGLRDLFDKDFTKFSKGQIKQKTIKNMVLLHNNKLSKNYITKGLIVPDNIIEKLGLNSSEAATATTRLSQHYGGFDFGFDELKNIRRNANSSNKLFEAMDKFAFGNPYRSSLYRTSLELIDEQLGNERGTFSSLKDKARKVLKKNGIKGFDINEIAGVTGTAKSGGGEFSQFMDVMDSNLNQKEMASFQSAFSRARKNIKNNPKNFATLSKQINKLTADFEKRYNVKLPRIRNSADVEKYYSPKRLQELKDQGLDIKKASKKLKYTIQMPKGASTINEFVNDPKRQLKTLLGKFEALGCGKAAGGRILMSNGGATLTKCAIAGQKKLEKILLKGAANETESSLANGILKAGKGLKNIASLKNLFGPAALAFGAATEAGIVGYDMLASGKTFKEAMGDSLLNYGLGDKTKIDPRKERDKRFRDVGTTEKEMGKIAAFENAIKEIEGLEQIYSAPEKAQTELDKAKKFYNPKIIEQRQKTYDNSRADIQDLNRTGTPDRLMNVDYDAGAKALKQAEDKSSIQKLESRGPQIFGSVFPKAEESRQQKLRDLNSYVNPAHNIFSAEDREAMGGYTYGFNEGGLAGLMKKKND